MSLSLAVVRGRCSGPAVVRVLPSGTTLATIAVTARLPGGRSTSVPVTIWDPPARIDALAEGDEVVVLGAARRRFFRGAGGTGSRVEVEADSVVPAGHARRVEALLRRARAALEDTGAA